MDCPSCKKYLHFTDRKFCVHCGFSLQANSNGPSTPNQHDFRRANSVVPLPSRETPSTQQRNASNLTANSLNINNNAPLTPIRAKSTLTTPNKSVNSTPVSHHTAPSLSTGMPLQEKRLSGGYRKGQPDVASLSQDMEAKGALKYVAIHTIMLGNELLIFIGMIRIWRKLHGIGLKNY